jgi:hypothetical protein
MKLTSVLVFGAAVLIFTPAHAADTGAGKKLHDAHCTGCHDTSVYSRREHQVKSLADLHEQLNECTHSAQVKLTAAEQEEIVKYLNEKYYKFK